jgi:hypothetical protein
MDKFRAGEQTDIILEYMRKHNVTMLALNNILNQRTLENTVSDRHISDTKLEVELFLYDLNSIYDLMHENMELLWELRDKA